MIRIQIGILYEKSSKNHMAVSRGLRANTGKQSHQIWMDVMFNPPPVPDNTLFTACAIAVMIVYLIVAQ
jgi:hypothetical protein